MALSSSNSMTSIIAAIIAFFIVTGGILYGSNSVKKQNYENEKFIEVVKMEKCKQVGFIQSNSVFTADQYKYVCQNGNTYVLNKDLKSPN